MPSRLVPARKVSAASSPTNWAHFDTNSSRFRRRPRPLSGVRKLCWSLGVNVEDQRRRQLAAGTTSRRTVCSAKSA
jgi:hypothetical protein